MPAVDTFGFQVREDDGTGTHDAAFTDLHAIAQGGVDANEALLANTDIARNGRLRADEAMVLDMRVMTDVSAAPDDQIVAKADERLDDGAFQDQRVLANVRFRRDAGPGADMAGRTISQLPGSQVARLAHGVGICIAQGNVDVMAFRRAVTGNVLERNDGQTLEVVPVDVGSVCGEGDDSVPGVLREVVMRKLTQLGRSEDDKLPGLVVYKCRWI